jgi:beta-lactamase regulating signal transducer with metallopeptidase domain
MISTLVPVLLVAALRAALAALAVGIALKLLGIRQVKPQKTTWSLLLWAALLLPFLPGGTVLPDSLAHRLPVFRLGFAATRQAEQPTAASTPQSAGNAVQLAEAWQQYAELSAAAKPQPTGRAQVQAAHGVTLPQLLRLAGFVWLAVALVLVLRLLLGLLAALRMWRSAEPVDFAPDVRLSKRLASPVTLGHAVLLPAEAGSWSEQKLRMVLAHERAHIAQYDFYLQILAGLYAAFYWPSPLGWWLKHKLYELGEALSDHAGQEQAPSRTSYAQLLLEFAALPRPTVPGVAMARTNHLSQRIERLLNETSFRHAFTPSRRTVLALAMIPVALIAATALVRVQAAATQEPAAQQTDQTPPPPPQAQFGQNQPGPDQANPAQLPPPPPQGPQGPGQPGAFGPQQGTQGGPQAFGFNRPGQPGQPGFGPQSGAPGFGAPGHGEGYILVGDEKNPPEAGRPGFGPALPPAEMEKASKLAKGHFLLFQHEGKSYLIDDASTIAQIEALDKQVGALHDQLRAEAHKQFAADHKAEVKVPNVAKEMDELNEALATLKAKQGATISEAELMEVQHKLFDLERRLDAGHPEQHPGAGPQGWPNGGPQFGQQPGPQGGPNFAGGPRPENFKGNDAMAKLGEQLGKAIREKDEKVHAIISDSLKNGKAKLVS